MEALRNPRARGPADLARTITNARTRAAPPAPPEPQQTVTEADQQDNIAPWQTNDSTSDNMPNATTTNTLSDQQGPLKQGRSAKKTASLTRKKALIESLEQEQSAVEAVSRTKVQISGDVVRDGSSATSSLLRTASNTVRVTAKVSRQLSRKPSTAKSRASFSSSVASKALTSETLPTDGSTGEGESERGSEETGADDGEDDWDHLIASVMGEDEGYGFLPTRSSRRGEETPATALSSNLPGMPDEESQDLHDDSDNDASHLGNTPAATPATAESGGPPREEAYRDTDEKAAGPSGAQPKIKRQMSLEELAEWDPSKDRKTGENGDGKSGDGPNGPSEQKRSEGDLGFLGMLGSAYEGGDGQTLLQKIVRCLALVFLGLRRKWMTNSSGQDKVLVSILITPIKRLERDANKSSKRVHFKLRKATTANKFFRPLQKSSNLKQTWLVGMLLPMSYDIFAFGLRLAFCDMYLQKLLAVWIIDIICDGAFSHPSIAMLISIAGKRACMLSLTPLTLLCLWLLPGSVEAGGHCSLTHYNCAKRNVLGSECNRQHAAQHRPIVFPTSICVGRGSHGALSKLLYCYYEPPADRIPPRARPNVSVDLVCMHDASLHHPRSPRQALRR